jgi:hypothetical protein
VAGHMTPNAGHGSSMVGALASIHRLIVLSVDRMYRRRRQADRQGKAQLAPWPPGSGTTEPFAPGAQPKDSSARLSGIDASGPPPLLLIPPAIHAVAAPVRENSQPCDFSE